jgi:site-specific DNA-methyltransferase (adenine-specific)
VGGGGFMGEDWDSFVPAPNTFEAIYGSLLPGAPMLCFAGSRTADWMGMSLRFAGFERRDTLQYLFGSGFPKSHDISKAIDDAKGAEREVVGEGRCNHVKGTSDQSDCKIRGGTKHKVTAPATGEAETWDGYGTALAPAHEPVILAMKPKDGTFAENALEHGTAGLNIDGGRVETDEDTSRPQGKDIKGGNWSGDGGSSELTTGGHNGKGRWPANVVLDEAAAELVDEQSGATDSKATPRHNNDTWGGNDNIYGDSEAVISHGYDDTGGASRFFYTSKASKSDRNAGLPPGEENDHPTVKPTDLMGWLLRLVEMPERNLILDPFCGSGTTLYVAQQMGLPAIGIDQDEESCELASKRLSEPSLFS